MSEDYGALPQPDYTYRGLRYSKPATTVRVYDEKLGRYRAATPEETARTLAAGNDAAPSPKSEANPLRLPFEEEEGYHRSAFLPLRIRTDTGESELATPGFLADPLRAALKIGAAFKGDLPPEEVTYKDIIDATGAVGGGGIALSSGRVPQGSLGMFVGPRAQLPEAQAAYRQMRNTPAPDVSDAELLAYLPEKISLSPSAIVGQSRARKLTQSGEPEDVTPRFLISDAPMRIKESAFLPEENLKDLIKVTPTEGSPIIYPQGGTTLRLNYLADVIEHPELFEAYPHFEMIYVNPKPSSELAGSYSSRGFGDPGTINVGISTPKDLRNTLLHEIQHAIQRDENWVRGASYSGSAPPKFDLAKAEFSDALDKFIPNDSRSEVQTLLNNYFRTPSKKEKAEFLDYLGSKYPFSTLTSDQFEYLVKKAKAYDDVWKKKVATYRTNPGEMEARMTESLQAVPEDELSTVVSGIPKAYLEMYKAGRRAMYDPVDITTGDRWEHLVGRYAKGGKVASHKNPLAMGYEKGGEVMRGLEAVQRGYADGGSVNPHGLRGAMRYDEGGMVDGGFGDASERDGGYDGVGPGIGGDPSISVAEDIDTGYLEGAMAPVPERSLMDRALGFAYERAMNAIESPVTTAINVATSFTPFGPVNALSNVLGGPTVGSVATGIGRSVGEALGIGTTSAPGTPTAASMSAPSTTSYSTGGDSRDIGVETMAPQEPTVVEVAPTLAPSYISSKVQPRSPSDIYGSLGVRRPGNPFTYAEGGYVPGKSGGMDDDVPAIIDGKQPARLSSGEFVFDAATVAALGDGNNAAGARKLDGLRKAIRKKAYGHEKQPPKNYSVGDLVRIYDRRR